MSLRAILWLGLGLILAFAPADARGQERPALVRVDAVRVEPVSRTQSVLGRVVAKQEGEVAARVAGPVAEVPVEPGDRVEPGDVLVRLDTTRLESEARLAEADRAAAIGERTAAEREVALLNQERDRLRRLEGSVAFSRASLDDKQRQIDVARSRAEAADARLERALVALEAAEADLADAAIKAPYPGVVVQRLVSPGAYVNTGQPVVRLVNHVEVEAEADVPAGLASRLAPGDVAPARFDDGTEALATLRAVIPVESPLTRTRAVRFALDGSRDAAVGESVRLDLPSNETRTAPTVAKDAINMGQGSPSVFVVGADGAVLARPVRLGPALKGRFVVEDGLDAGEVVVVRGNERLRPGQKVSVEGEAVPASAGAGTGSGA